MVSVILLFFFLLLPILLSMCSTILGRKVYPLRKYLFVLMIVVGVALFMYKDKVSSTFSAFFILNLKKNHIDLYLFVFNCQASKATADSDSGIGLGEILLLVSLACDGITGAVQVIQKIHFPTQFFSEIVRSYFFIKLPIHFTYITLSSMYRKE